MEFNENSVVWGMKDFREPYKCIMIKVAEKNKKYGTKKYLECAKFKKSRTIYCIIWVYLL